MSTGGNTVAKGTDPRNLIDKVVREKIRMTVYWKMHCFALTAESVIDKATDLKYIGGTTGTKALPTPFLCLLLKLLELQPDQEIIRLFIEQEDLKYLRLLGCFYVRLTYPADAVYTMLEPLYRDYRKVRYISQDQKLSLVHIDDFIDELLRQERSCSTILPTLQNRHLLEESKLLAPRKSSLIKDVENYEISSESSDDDDGGDGEK